MRIKFFLTAFLIISLSTISTAQFKFPFQNPNLSIEERVNDLISRMTLEEKVSQMVYNAPSIERLDIPEYNWWNECLHGVARNGLATVFPQAIGLAAMWDKELMHRIGETISDEARAKHNIALSQGKRGIYQGLTFWSPNINIFRDPRWGRGMETYGEDPHLTGQLAIQFIKGLQGDDPHYLKLVATAKHFAVHSGPEPERHSFEVSVSDYDLWETYLPAFKMSVIDAKVEAIMCAYNSLYGNACCSNDPLLNNILRNEWGFKGHVVSDCWAIADIWQYHKQAKDAAEASAKAVKAGTDLNCGVSFHHLTKAVNDGLISEEELSVPLQRLFEDRIKLGMFDPPEMVPFSKLNRSHLDTEENKKLALEAAQKSIVLLKNENNILPLSKEINTIAVIGPNANDEEVLYGNYNGFPSDPITPLEGLRRKFPNKNIIFEPGCSIAENIYSFNIIPSSCFFTNNDKSQNGLLGEYYDNVDFSGEPKFERIDKDIHFNWGDSSPIENSISSQFSVRWNGYLVPEKSGKYALGASGLDGFQLTYEDSILVKFQTTHGAHKVYNLVELNAGQQYKIKLEFKGSNRYSFIQLLWANANENLEERAIEAVKKSDVAILFLGLSPRLEGEEMDVKVEGFRGGDRLSLDLPKTQENLLIKLHEIGKPIVLVLLNGSALSINWADKNIPAIIESWYGGQAAGTAIANVLFGDYNPAGRLPVTFYKSVEQTPPFIDYSMKERTYRYFTQEPLYPFGFGLSYSSFQYSNPEVIPTAINENECAILSINIKNTGKYDGDEVVQLYVKGSGVDNNGAIKTLKGFQRVHIKSGEVKNIKFEINKEMLEEFRDGKGFSTEPGVYQIMIGSSSREKDLKTANVVLK
jgi:beta-glucosidase